MNITPSKRIQSLGGYAFDEIAKRITALREQGIAVTDFGVGDPREPTPEVAREAARAGIDAHATSGYPSYIGSPRYREAVASWMEERFGVSLDPAREVAATIGSKEAVFNFAEGLVDPGDLVLAPSPGYPPYARGTLFAEGKTWFYPLDGHNGFSPDLDAIPVEVARAAKVMWLCNPNAPTGLVLRGRELERVVQFAADHEIVLASDEAYSEIWFGEEPPPSTLEVSRDGVIAFHSLSKRSAMTGWRVGWVAGDERIVDIFKKVKTNIDSGTANFIQDAAVAALQDEQHVIAMRASYQRRRELMTAGLREAGLTPPNPEASLYLWQKAPEGMDGVELAKRLLEPDVAVGTMPGAILAEATEGGRNPGVPYVRFALVPTLEDTERAAERIARMRF